MGWFDKAAAAAKVAANVAREAAQEVAADLEAEHGGKAEYEELKQTWQKVKEQTKEGAAQALAAKDEALQEFGASESGQAIGEATRRFGAMVNKLPVLSALTDAAQSRHGIGYLRDHFAEDPADPVRALWLAEAIGRVRDDLNRYRLVRTLTSPTYAVMSQSMKAAGQLGQEGEDPAEMKLLKVAFVRGRNRVRADASDAESLHVLSRVYFAQNKPARAAHFSKLALLADPSQPLPWVTLSRIYLEVEQRQNARKAAERAVNEGAGYGNEILARLVLVEGAKTKDDILTYEQYRERITPEAKVQYLGVAVSGSDWWDDLKQRQSDKASQLMD